MRNIFDQYDHPENRLTHALMCTLAIDRPLRNDFVTWAVGKRIGSRELFVLDQSLPGEQELVDENEAERRGLPDGCIHDERAGLW